mmetsp:Transcript_22570/g.20493  ORF Transcript_22570/g.20493 Transcript_22570/m.20493 type:complete len:389 (+) Transcript_22570:63-1229(+)
MFKFNIILFLLYIILQFNLYQCELSINTNIKPVYEENVIVSTLTEGYLDRPTGIVLDNNEEYLYIVNLFNTITSHIIKVNMNTLEVTPLAETFQFRSPVGITIDKQDNIYITDETAVIVIPKTDQDVAYILAGKHEDLEYDVDPVSSNIIDGKMTIIDGSNSIATFSYPGCLTMDKTDKYVYVSDHLGSKVRRVDTSDGSTITIAKMDNDVILNENIRSNGLINYNNEYLLISSQYSNNLIYKISLKDIYPTNYMPFISTSVSFGWIDGSINKFSKFGQEIHGLSMDDQDNLYVISKYVNGDYESNDYYISIRRIDGNTGYTTTLAGSFIDYPSDELSKKSNEIKFQSTYYMTASSNSSYIILSDYNNNMIKIITCIDGTYMSHGQCI